MLTAVSTHHAKFSEAMRGDDNCHLHIGKTIKPLTRHAPLPQPWPQFTVDRGRRRYIHFVCT